MAKITKEQVQKAFVDKMKRRNILLYEYYKEEYFSKDYPYKFIAQAISEDLGIPVTHLMIKLLYHRIINKQKAALPSQVATPTPAVDTFSGKQVIKDEKTEEMEKVQEKKPKYDFYATDTTPKPDPIREALKDYLPKDKQ